MLFRLRQLFNAVSTWLFGEGISAHPSKSCGFVDLQFPSDKVGTHTLGLELFDTKEGLLRYSLSHNPPVYKQFQCLDPLVAPIIQQCTVADAILA
jgi:hypothetical protein